LPESITNPQEVATMKLSRTQVERKSRALPQLRFEDQQLTSFSGLVLFQALFARLDLLARLRQCFGQLPRSRAYGYATVVLSLVVHILLGYRHLRDSCFYNDDPLVLRLLQLRRLPHVATVSRVLTRITHTMVEQLRHLLCSLVLQRLAALGLRRITLDFDGSVLGTNRCAEGTAVGFNPKNKGQRSYYPLFCTVAQTGQVFDFLFRSGNVHDSNGARQFILACIHEVRTALPGVHIEVRMDSAFFSHDIVAPLHQLGVDFTLSVPFERFPELKQIIESRHFWWRLNAEVSYFEPRWKPKDWSRRFRMLVVRTLQPVRRKGPLQLDLFIPYAYNYEFQVVVTNKTLAPQHVVAFHHGRGAQEAVFAELKSQGQMDYVPTRTLLGNQTYLFAAVLAHNLNRELQMESNPPQRTTTEKRAALWLFEQLATVRQRLVQRAGQLTRPHGVLTLTVSANHAARRDLLHHLESLQAA
jgi:Transposase DDE domain group 1